MRLAGIEAGGTKFVIGVQDENQNIIAQTSIPTETPEITLKKCLDYLKDYEFDALGIACFGPVNLNPKSPDYGSITSTPKPHWQNTPVVSYFKQHLKVPIGFDTDVNGACLAEVLWGNGKDVDHCLYLTVGTGIGGGFISNNTIHHGKLHPEMGHFLVSKHPDDHFDGLCPYHGHCLEGMASGISIQKRYGTEPENLAEDHPFWDIEAYYLAQACMTYSLILSPDRILLGGGVMHQKQLYPKIREQLEKLLNNYIQDEDIFNHVSQYIMEPYFEAAGLWGAFALARKVLEDE